MTEQEKINKIKEVYRLRVMYGRAGDRLHKQMLAILRAYHDGDVGKSRSTLEKFYKVFAKDPTAIPSDTLYHMVHPMMVSREPLLAFKAQCEKMIEHQAKSFALYKWSRDSDVCKGIGPIFFGSMIAEFGYDLHNYKSVQAVWKRMGLAVMDGIRQQKITKNPEEAIRHGYAPQRRSLMWNIANKMVMAQVRSSEERDEKNKPIGPSRAIHPMGQVYLDRKALELERGIAPFIAEARAKRYMTKEFLKCFYLEARRTKVQADSIASLSATAAVDHLRSENHISVVNGGTPSSRKRKQKQAAGATNSRSGLLSHIADASSGSLPEQQDISVTSPLSDDSPMASPSADILPTLDAAE